MLSLAEKIKASKECCRKVKEFIAEKKQSAIDRLFNCDWDIFIVKQDEITGQYTGAAACGKTLCC